MDFYETIEKRHMVRDFSDKPVPSDVIERILAAGMKAPSNDHMRSWEFLVVTDKEKIESILKKIPKKVSDKRVDFIMKSWRLKDECQQHMYRDAIPRQYTMLSHSGCLILPFFKQKSPLLTPKNLSALNSFASVWCCIENILLAATAQGLGCALRIPFDDEIDYIAGIVHAPKEYSFPCYLSVGYPAEEAAPVRQIDIDVSQHIHCNEW